MPWNPWPHLRGMTGHMRVEYAGTSRGAPVSNEKCTRIQWLRAGGFRWLASGKVASENWLPWIPQKNPARQARDSASL